MTTPAAEDEDELTALYDAVMPRSDLVGKGANGIPRFLISKSADGLLDPDYVRSLIAKGEPVPAQADDGKVTFTGSPAAIAKLIHSAGTRPVTAADDVAKAAPADPESAEIAKALADYERIVKAKYSAAEIKTMGGKGQAYKNPDGHYSYPIADTADLDNAIHAVGRGGSGHDAIRKYIIGRAKTLGASSKIPDNWASDGSLKETVSKDMGPDLDGSPDQMGSMDVTVPLAAPEGDAPGDPTDPGSPAWEAIDAATACKWTSILSRARVAIDLLADRELLEAASADPGDQENAWDLQDVCCAIDYAISVLAPYAVAEQSEADCGGDELMASIGKAMAGFDGIPLDTIEALAQVRKAGRVLSAANEGLIRDAAAGLQKVLAALPSAPQADDSGQPVAKQKETPVSGQPEPVAKDAQPSPDEQARNAGPVNAGGTTGLGEPRSTGPDGALPGDGPQAGKPGDVPGRTVIKAAHMVIYDHRGHASGICDPASILTKVAKADGDSGDDGDKTMQAVFDQDGNLIGIVDPSAITPVSGAGGKKPEEGDGKPADAKDMTPQPPGDAGTPASGNPDDVTKSATETTQTPDTQALELTEVLKSLVTVVETALDKREPAEDVAKQADVAELRGQIDVLKGQVEAYGQKLAPPKVFTNGQVPHPDQLRGQDRSTAQVDVAKARERKAELYSANGPDQARIAKEMQSDAIGVLTAIHAGQR